MFAENIVTTSAFYVAGGTLPINAVSYVERHADRDLFEALLRGEFCYVLTTRQMGKSSLMVRTAAKLRASHYKVAVLDLTAVGQNLTLDQWYDGLLLSLGKQLDLEDELEDFWENNPRLGPMHRFFAALKEVVMPAVLSPAASRGAVSPIFPASDMQGGSTAESPCTANGLIIFVDEIDSVRSLPFSPDEFFAGIRECYNRRAQDPEFQKVTFCLLGVASPVDLIRETRMSPFNIGHRILLTDFTAEEAAALAAGLVNSGGAGSGRKGWNDQKHLSAESTALSHLLLARVLYWTNGHPYMTQRFCRAIAEVQSAANAPAATVELVDKICENLFLTKSARDTDDNLAFVRNRLLRSEVDLTALLDLYTVIKKGKRVKDDETNPLCPVLRLSGVCKVEDGLLKVRNRIYDRVFDREWVEQHMPDAERRRQKAAFRAGALRVAVVSGAIALVMIALTWRAFVSERMARNALADARRETSVAKAAQAREDIQRIEALNAKNEAEKAMHAAMEAKRTEGLALNDASKSAIQAKQEASNARAATKRATTLAAMQQQAEKAAEQQRAIALAEAESNRRNLYVAQMNRAYAAYHARDYIHARQLLNAVRPEKGKADLRGFEWRLLWRLCQDQSAFVFPLHYYRVAISPDGRTAAFTGSNGLQLWDVERRRPRRTLFHGVSGNSAAFSPDNSMAAMACNDGKIRIKKLFGPQPPVEIPVTEKGRAVAVQFSPNNQWLAASTKDGTGRVSVWNIADRHKIVEFTPPESVPLQQYDDNQAIGFSPDGRHFAIGWSYGILQIFDTALWKPEVTETLTPGQRIWALKYASKGNLIALGDWQGAITLWDTGLQQISLVKLTGGKGAVLALDFSPDGKTLVSGGQDSLVRLWDTATGALHAAMPGHTHQIEGIAYSPRNDWILTTADDGTMRYWKPEGVSEYEKIALPSNSQKHWILPDGPTLVNVLEDGQLQVTDLMTKRTRHLLPFMNPIQESVYYRHNDLIAARLKNGIVRVLRLPSGEMIGEAHIYEEISSIRLDWQAGGRVIAWADTLGNVTIWDVISRRIIGKAKAPEDLQHWEVLNSGKTLLFYEGNEEAQKLSLVSVGSGRTLRSEQWTNAGNYWLSHASPEAALTVASQTRASLWDLLSGRELGMTAPHLQAISTAAFSNRSGLFATGSFDKTIILSNAADGSQKGVLRGHGDVIDSIRFAPNDRTLASHSWDGEVKLWRSDNMEEIGRIQTPVRRVNSPLTYLPERGLLALEDDANTLYLYRAPLLSDTDVKVKTVTRTQRRPVSKAARLQHVALESRLR